MKDFLPALLLNAQNVSWGKQHQSHVVPTPPTPPPLLFFFLFGNKRRATVAMSEWKNTGLELCDETDLPLKEGGGQPRVSLADI